MRRTTTSRPPHNIRIRPGRLSDLARLAQIENQVFETDRISPRSFRRFLSGASSSLLVADADGEIAGYVLLLLRAGASVARLYSIATAPQWSDQGVGARLLAAAEAEALAHNRAIVRLEVRETNKTAIRLYGGSGYRQFARQDEYYEDLGNALRFQKILRPRSRS